MTILMARVPDELAGMRLDQCLAEMFPDYSRSKLQTWIKAGRVTGKWRGAQRQGEAGWR